MGSDWSIPCKVTSQPASGEHEDGGADEASMVRVLNLAGLSVHQLVVGHVHPVFLKVQEPEVVLLDVFVADLAVYLDYVRVVLQQSTMITLDI